MTNREPWRVSTKNGLDSLLETRFVLFALCVAWIDLSFGLEFLPFTHQSFEESMCTSPLEDMAHRQDPFFSFR